jgi:hypothetical protein
MIHARLVTQETKQSEGSIDRRVPQHGNESGIAAPKI